MKKGMSLLLAAGQEKSTATVYSVRRFLTKQIAVVIV